MKNKTILTVVSVLNTILIALSLAGCIYVISRNFGLYYIITPATEIAAVLFSVLYYVKGYKKDGARYYKLFMLFYAFTYLAETLAGILDYKTIGVASSADSLLLIVSMVMYGNTLILAIGKDLGKKVSYALCFFNIFIYTLPVIGSMIPGVIIYADAGHKASNIILYCTWLVMALNAFIMTFAKYTDKEIRKGI